MMDSISSGRCGLWLLKTAVEFLPLRSQVMQIWRTASGPWLPVFRHIWPSRSIPSRSPSQLQVRPRDRPTDKDASWRGSTRGRVVARIDVMIEQPSRPDFPRPPDPIDRPPPDIKPVPPPDIPLPVGVP